MGNEKKISPNEVGLEVGLVLSKFFFKTEHLHFGFWPDDLEISVDNLKKSQDYHSEKIINSIPSDVNTILDVGSGSGGLAEKLVEKNYKVECVSPSHFLSDAIENKLVEKVRVHRSTFENLDIKTKSPSPVMLPKAVAFFTPLLFNLTILIMIYSTHTF